MPNIVLKCSDVSKKIGKKEIINNFSLRLYEGDILGFVGPNGAGKTTTIKLILGLQSLTNGKIEINGFDIVKNFSKAIANVGAIVENPDMYMQMTGYENLMLIAKIYDIEKKRVEEVIKIIGLANDIDKKVKKYSLGMRQRLGIAQAILHKPKLLILDEPTNGLDPKGIAEIRNLLMTLAKTEKIAIMISSHILSELEFLCNKVCIIKNGVVICNTSIEKLKKEQNIIDYFIEVSSIDLCNIIANYEIIDNKHIKVTSSRKEINNIIKTLILNDINIYEIKKNNRILENIFLDCTRGKYID